MATKTYLTETKDGITYVHHRATGRRVGVADVGRCYRLFYGSGHTVDVAKGACSSFDALVRRVRRDILRDQLPIVDVHAVGPYC